MTSSYSHPQRRHWPVSRPIKVLVRDELHEIKRLLTLPRSTRILYISSYIHTARRSHCLGFFSTAACSLMRSAPSGRLIASAHPTKRQHKTRQ